MNQRELINQRLKNVMLSDRRGGVETMLASLKSDINALLESYMYLDADKTSAELEISDDGTYAVRITAIADRLIDSGKMID